MLFNAPSFIFHYFIFRGKIAVWPISCAMKIFVVKILLVKMFIANILMAKILNTIKFIY